jgi:ribosome-binding factor A
MSRRRWGDPLARDPHRRQARVNDLIRRALGIIFEREYRDRVSALITVTEVRTSGDLRHARIFVAIYADKPKQEEAIRFLQNSRPELRQLLGSEVILKYLPTLDFVLDLSAERAQRIERLLSGHDPDGEPI